MTNKFCAQWILCAAVFAWAVISSVAVCSAGSSPKNQSGISNTDPITAAKSAAKRGDYTTASRLYRQLAEQGNASAQFELGLMYEDGKGVSQDFKETAKWYQLSAAQGNWLALNNLGLLYEDGNGVPKDLKEAVKWYQLAVEQKDKTGQPLGQVLKNLVTALYNLGALYEEGTGVPKDLKEAAKWYQLAAQKGNDTALNKLDTMYQAGLYGRECAPARQPDGSWMFTVQSDRRKCLIYGADYVLREHAQFLKDSWKNGIFCAGTPEHCDKYREREINKATERIMERR